MTDHTDGGPPDTAAEFVVVDDTEEGTAPAEQPAAGPAAPQPEPVSLTLNAVRVRQLSALRRGAYRARSYCVVAAVGCAVAAAQLALMTVRHVRVAGWQVRPIGYVCAILAAAMAGAFFLRRMAELTRELRPGRGFPVVGPSDDPQPDLSTLSDGSHTWKNLEQMREGS